MPLDASGGDARIVLALDLSSTVGVAWGPLCDPLPRFTRWPLYAEGGEGGRYASFDNELMEMVERVQPAMMVVESTLSLAALARYSSYGIASQQITLRGFAKAQAWRSSCAFSEVDARTVRAEVAGLPRSLSRDVAKREVMRFCYRRGLKVPDDNAGDACMIWFYQRQKVMRKPPCAGPLFRETMEGI